MPDKPDKSTKPKSSKYARKRRSSLEATHDGHSAPVHGCTLCTPNIAAQAAERRRVEGLRPSWAPPKEEHEGGDGEEDDDDDDDDDDQATV